MMYASTSWFFTKQHCRKNRCSHPLTVRISINFFQIIKLTPRRIPRPLPLSILLISPPFFYHLSCTQLPSHLTLILVASTVPSPRASFLYLHHARRVCDFGAVGPTCPAGSQLLNGSLSILTRSTL